MIETPLWLATFQSFAPGAAAAAWAGVGAAPGGPDGEWPNTSAIAIAAATTSAATAAVTAVRGKRLDRGSGVAASRSSSMSSAAWMRAIRSSATASSCSSRAIRRSRPRALSLGATPTGDVWRFWMHQSTGREWSRHYPSVPLEAHGSQPMLHLGHRAARRAGRSRLHYQLEIALDTARIVGVEALLWWQSPARGLVSSAEFIPSPRRRGEMRSMPQGFLGLEVTETALVQEGHAGERSRAELQ